MALGDIKTDAHHGKQRAYLYVSPLKKVKDSWVGTAQFQWAGKGPTRTHPLRWPGSMPKPELHVAGKKLMVTEHDPATKKPVTYEYGHKPENASTGEQAHLEVKKEEDPGALKKAGAALKKGLGHAFEALADPFKKSYRLIAGRDRKEYRHEVASWAKNIGKTEAVETKKMLGTFKKALTGGTVSHEEKVQAVNQMVDIAKLIAIGGFYGSIAANEGIAGLIGTILSPGEEIAGMMLDKPLRRITKKVFGHEHGILPSAFYNHDVSATYESGDALKAVMKGVEAILSGLGEEDLSDDDIAEGLASSGVKAEDKDKIMKAMNKKTDSNPARVLAAIVLTDNDILAVVEASTGKLGFDDAVLVRGIKKLTVLGAKAGGDIRRLASQVLKALTEEVEHVVDSIDPMIAPEPATAPKTKTKTKKPTSLPEDEALAPTKLATLTSAAERQKVIKALLAAASVLDR